MHSSDDLFGDSLPVLEEWYPKTLLPFFSDVLQVPKYATVERYMQLWLRWTANVHEIKETECTRIWKILSEKWTACDPRIKATFIAKAWVPSKSKVTGIFQLAAPRECLIPDDLNLLSIFGNLPNVQFVWYPNQTEKLENGMNRVYSEMGVKNLSSSVQQQLIMGVNTSGGDSVSQCQPVDPSEGILCPGLFRAILGFLARRRIWPAEL